MSQSKRFLNFIRAKDSFTNGYSQHGNPKLRRDDIRGNLTGDEAKSFYESVVSSRSCDNVEDTEMLVRPETRSVYRTGAESSGTRRKRKYRPQECYAKLTKTRSETKISAKHDRLGNKFLQYAQEGNLKELRSLLRDGAIDINTTDRFEWTAIMCAAHSGEKNIVRYLLHKGALWTNVVNCQGKTAVDIARRSGHFEIVELFQSQVEERSLCTEDNDNLGKSRSRDYKSMKFWCSVCEQEFTEEEKRHKSSTVHQFNCQHKPHRPYYYIAEDNPGYKMMVKAGWDEEQGLGPYGLGRKYPVKTLLKRDRLGLGSVQTDKKARVTHFGPNDEAAVKKKKTDVKGKSKVSKKLTKKEKYYKERKEKTWEQNMRIYMNTD